MTTTSPKQKIVCQLNSEGFFAGLAVADESPLEPGVFHIPGGCIDAPAPTIPEGKLAKWEDKWVFIDVQNLVDSTSKDVEKTREELLTHRLLELKASLYNSDFKVLPDYDRPNEDIIVQRQLWRTEVREIEEQLQLLNSAEA